MSDSGNSEDGAPKYPTNMELLDERNKKKGFFHDKSSNKTFMKITGILAIVAVLVLVIVLPVYFAVIEPNNESNNEDSTSTAATTTAATTTTATEIPENERFDCLPEQNPTKESCIQRGCTWSETSTGAPQCYFSGPAMYSFKEYVNEGDDSGIFATLSLDQPDANYYGEQYSTLRVEGTYISDNTMRLKIYPSTGEPRYEVPMEHKTPTESNNKLYDLSMADDNGPFGVKVSRKSNGKILFDTSVGQLIYADQFLQISTRVASEYIYGFGEHMHTSLKHDMNWKTYGIFTRDVNVMPDMNLYGAHPYFMCMEGDGNAYGVFFVNSNAMDVTLQPTPAITYRTVGGILDFYIFLGPSPEAVNQQYMSVIGLPYFPPYWSLGFQLCRWGYADLEELKTVVNRTLATGIPYDVQYTDIDYMERQMDFTIDEVAFNGLEDYVRTFKNENKMRYILMFDPAIPGNETEPYPPFDNGIRDDIFIKYANGDLAWGKVWPDLPNITVNESQPKEYQVEHYRAHTAYPDFFNPNTSVWWTNLTLDFYERLEFDGIWIDMNEPTSFIDGSPNGCPENMYDYPPYLPQPSRDDLFDDTICMQSLQYNPKTGTNTAHYNLHSLYGHSETLPTLEACREATGKRCIIVSRSTFPGSGKYTGHWLGDNKSRWDHLAASIIGMIEFTLFGFPYNGADVCGFFEDTEYELCLRWTQLGAFYPFYRNHNEKDSIDQDPAVFGQSFTNATIGAMETRYRLLPYLYTLFFDAHVEGSTVVRALMHEFPEDIQTYEVQRQFMWGSGLLITPVLDKGHTSVEGYFPNARWFDYYSGEELTMVLPGKFVLDAPIDKINVHVKGGSIIPTQEPAKTTYYSRQNPMGLIVALDANNEANGKLFWDDGESIDTIENNDYMLMNFTSQMSRLDIQIDKEAPSTLNVTGLYFATVTIYGIRDEDLHNNVTVNNVLVRSEIIPKDLSEDASGDYNWNNNTLELTGLHLALTKDHVIDWS